MAALPLEQTLQRDLNRGISNAEETILGLVGALGGMYVTAAGARIDYPNGLYTELEVIVDPLPASLPRGHLWIEPQPQRAGGSLRWIPSFYHRQPE